MKKRMDYAALITIISVVSAILISFLTYRKEKADRIEEDKKDSLNQAALQEARDTIVRLNEEAAIKAALYAEEASKRAEQLNEQQARLISDQQKVIELQRENEKKAIELNNEITGGNSFCEVLTFNYADSGCELFLINNGAYPTYDIVVTITEYDGYPAPADSAWVLVEDFSKFLSEQTTFSISSLKRNPNVQFLSRYIYKYASFEKRFNIFINQRNGRFKQQLILRKKGKEWFRASRIIRESDGKEVSLQIDPPFLYPNETAKSIWHH